MDVTCLFIRVPRLSSQIKVMVDPPEFISMIIRSIDQKEKARIFRKVWTSKERLHQVFVELSKEETEEVLDKAERAQKESNDSAQKSRTQGGK